DLLITNPVPESPQQDHANQPSNLASLPPDACAGWSAVDQLLSAPAWHHGSPAQAPESTSTPSARAPPPRAPLSCRPPPTSGRWIDAGAGRQGGRRFKEQVNRHVGSVSSLRRGRWFPILLLILILPPCQRPSPDAMCSSVSPRLALEKRRWRSRSRTNLSR